MPETFRTIGQYIEDRTRRLGMSVRALSIELGWSESFLYAVARGNFGISLDRAHALALYVHVNLNKGRPGDSPTLEEYIVICLAAGLPWPPATTLPRDILSTTAADLDAFSLLELVRYAEYLRTRPKSEELIAQAVEALREEPEVELPAHVVALAQRIAHLPQSLQFEAVARLGDTVAFVERIAGGQEG